MEYADTFSRDVLGYFDRIKNTLTQAVSFLNRRKIQSEIVNVRFFYFVPSTLKEAIRVKKVDECMTQHYCIINNHIRNPGKKLMNKIKRCWKLVQPVRCEH